MQIAAPHGLYKTRIHCRKTYQHLSTKQWNIVEPFEMLEEFTPYMFDENQGLINAIDESH